MEDFGNLRLQILEEFRNSGLGIGEFLTKVKSFKNDFLQSYIKYILLTNEFTLRDLNHLRGL